MTQQWQKFSQNLNLASFTGSSPIPTIAGSSSSGRIELPVGVFGGKLVQLAIATQNVILYDFSLFQNSTALATSVHEFIRVIDITQFYQKVDLSKWFQNTDTVPKASIYFEGTNRSAVPSGTITLELYIEAPGSGRI